ncbi:type IV toxin-antitoxin system AbiEi family antitoxin domain-containing protein [Pyrococcus kukulkanii]|uniref:type IV toxin-antitoxin system AbiEi family antitoxin domain-containing protein n=1 Tax=Pyrococcus kukulkanii TaxID=1609559 RepID=UPI00356A2D09
MRQLAIKYVVSRFGGNAITKEELKDISKRFGIDIDYFVNYMLSQGYIVRILRGVYYVRTIEEIGLKLAPNVFRVIAKGLNKLKLRWYYGLFTALRLNGITHEYFNTIFVLNDKVVRSKTVEILGENVKFIKIKPDLASFGIIKSDEVRFSDLEKTILDFVYLSRYNKKLKPRAEGVLVEYKDKINWVILCNYLQKYPKSVQREVLKYEREGIC